MTDRLDEELRRALHDEADSVTPTEGLSAIRSRTRRSSTRSGVSRWLPALAGAVVAAAVVGGVAYVAMDDPTGQQSPPVATDPTTNPTTGTTTTTAPPPGEAELELWFVTNERFVTPETVSAPSTGDPLSDAVNALMTTEPADPDNSNGGWLCYGDATDVESVTREGPQVRVQLTGDQTSTVDCAGSKDILVQQLAYTLAAVDPAVSSVVVDGMGTGQVSASLDVYARASIIIETPAQGETVTSPVKVSGESTANEGTVQWVVLDSSGNEVARDFYTGGSMGEFLPYSFRVDLEPGDYTVKLYEESAKDGSEFGTVTKDFTVE